LSSLAGEATATTRQRFRVSWVMALPYPVRNMLRRWSGMLGMVAGVGIALGVSMTMLAMGRATVDLFTADYLRSAADLYVIQEGGTLIPILPSDTPGTIRHARNAMAQIRAIPGVGAVVGVTSAPLAREREGPTRPDAPRELVATMGVDGDPERIDGMVLLKAGRWLRRSDEVVLGSKLSREKHLAVGDLVRLAGRDFRVVGIGRLRGFGYGADSMAYMEYRSLRQRADIGDTLQIIAVDAADPERARQRIEEMGSYSVLAPPDLVRQAEAVNATQMVFYWIFNLLALTIAGLFVTNMLGRAVSERRLEFGTLRAIGIPTRTILVTVVMEALVICLVAGVVGIVLSLVLGHWLNGWAAVEYGIETLYSTDPGLFATVFALALALGAVAGFVPARDATRVDPVEVLREA